MHASPACWCHSMYGPKVPARRCGPVALRCTGAAESRLRRISDCREGPPPRPRTNAGAAAASGWSCGQCDPPVPARTHGRAGGSPEALPGPKPRRAWTLPDDRRRGSRHLRPAPEGSKQQSAWTQHVRRAAACRRGGSVDSTMLFRCRPRNARTQVTGTPGVPPADMGRVRQKSDNTSPLVVLFPGDSPRPAETDFYCHGGWNSAVIPCTRRSYEAIEPSQVRRFSCAESTGAAHTTVTAVAGCDCSLEATAGPARGRCPGHHLGDELHAASQVQPARRGGRADPARSHGRAGHRHRSPQQDPAARPHHR